MLFLLLTDSLELMCRNRGPPKAGNVEAQVLDLFGARPPYTILMLEGSLLRKEL